MNDWQALLLMFLTGGLLGTIYLGALWLTLQRLQYARHPALWLLASLLVRMVLLLTAFYFVLGDGHWPRLLAVLAGFVTLRIFATRGIRRQATARDSDREKPA